MNLRRALCAAAGIVALIAFGPTVPVGALSLSPTNWSSTIDSITPDSDAVAVRLLPGGEAIRVTASPGHEVIVPGYQREPYLRIAADGTTSVNLRSPAVAMNSTTTGTSTDLAADPSAPPEWKELGHDGWVQWHDHRIHEMPGVASPLKWNLPIIVDGQVVAITGTLTETPPASVALELLFAAAIGVLGVGVVLLVAWRTSDPEAGAIGVLIGSVLAVWSSFIVWSRTPVGFDHPLPLVGLAGLALVAALVALRPSYARLVATLVSVAALCGWVAVQWTVLTSTHVPASDASNPRRLLLPLIAGVAIGAAALTIRSAGQAQAGIAPEPR